MHTGNGNDENYQDHIGKCDQPTFSLFSVMRNVKKVDL